MSADTTEAPPEEAEGPAVQTSNYDLIRRRLSAQGEELRERAEALNARRQEYFGSTAMAVVGQDRIRTEHNCVPVDIVSVGGKLLFGYNVFIGLKKTTAVEDVFSLHSFRRGEEGIELDHVSQDSSKNFLSDPEFRRHFDDLYTYYKDAHLLQLRRIEGKLLAIFQIGSSRKDVRVLRWSVSANGEVSYIDNAGDRDNQPAPSHDFTWRSVTREDHVLGRHPHVSILDKVFVETVGGDLTIKVEDNTDDGLGIFREPVDDANQSLGDAVIEFAEVGVLILLKIRPYREETFRYFVFNTVTQDVGRIDAIGQSCIQLPEDHGVIYPGGYVLADGERRRFDLESGGMRYIECIRSPNGEDVLYVFYQPADGRYLLFAYNLIRKEVQNPIRCHGYSVFDDGSMIVFRVMGDDPTRVHPMQIWETPFVSDEHAAAQPTEDTFFSRIGNAELVRGISETLSIARMIDNQEPSVPVYEALIGAVQRTQDSFFWLVDDEAKLAEPLKEIAGTSELIIDEFVKVRELQDRAKEVLGELEDDQRTIMADTRWENWSDLQLFIDGLSELRGQRGRLITARETRYIDRGRLDELEEDVVERFDALSRATVEYLLAEDALTPYRGSIQELVDQVEEVQDTVEATKLRDRLDEIGEGLTLLTEVLSGLQVDDPNARTQILEGIAEILSLQNRARAMIDGRRRTLMEREGRAEFTVQFQLFSQSIQSSVAMADTPERCDELLTRLMVQLEELESRFSEFDEFLGQLTEKREELFEVFENRKQSLLEERQRRAHNTAEAAERILQGIQRRTARMRDVDELNAYFAADPMVLKVRELVESLRELDDPVRADDVQTRLRTVQDESIRTLRDKVDLYEEGADNVIRFGEHRFSVNTQEVELTMVARSGQMMLHVTGTDFFEPVDDEEFQKTREFWNQHLVSESPEVYRAEYLAAQILFDAEAGKEGLSIQGLHEKHLDEAGFGPLIRRYIEERFDEGYERGVHDSDAAVILDRVVGMYVTAGLLRFSPRARALATLFWTFKGKKEFGDSWARRARSFGRLRESLEHHGPLRKLGEEFANPLKEFGVELGMLEDDADAGAVSREAGAYLAEELVERDPHFVVSEDAQSLRDGFLEHLDREHTQLEFLEDLQELEEDLGARWELVTSWLSGFLDRHGEDHPGWTRALHDAVALLMTEDHLPHEVSSTRIFAEVPGLLGQHPRIRDQVMELYLDEFLARLRHFRDVRIPAYRRYRELSHEVLERERRRLRLEELKPRVLSTFVRNQLIDEVYLPLIGNNLAKQLGAVGDQGRSDRSGLLLLISPPGYGKTTLMEYIASRLGLVFMSINGPSLGHGVTSLDPAEAPNATARQEVEKVNLALEMGNNVLLYLDDIQHTDSEFLQKFISLCDATRRIEGVWKGQTRTYDMRGKRFAVVMAGNPYNEAGERFRIPDMLANRADTYNLGDILDGREDAFALSYVENALTSNSALAPLATRDREDLRRFLRIADGESIPLTEMTHDYSSGEAGEIVAILQKMITIQGVLLKVNQAYIQSANQDDRYRTEPPFMLQGSYRNMARLTARVVGAMNEQELQELIDDHYTGEAQTLTTGAEANLLKLAEIRGRMSESQQERWEEIRREFQRRNMMGGDDDPVARVASPLAGLVQKLDDVHGALSQDRLAGEMEQMRDALLELLARMK